MVQERRETLEGDTAEHEAVRPDASWRLDYFKRGRYFAVFDGEDNPQRIIAGTRAQELLRILICKNQHIKQDIVNAFRPLIYEAFVDEFDLTEEGQEYQNELESRQPRNSSKESTEEVYRRYWTGHLMPNGISADDVAERIVKSESRVRVALAWGDISPKILEGKIDELAGIIRMYHPQGERGK